MKISKVVAFMAVSASALAFSFVGVVSAHVVVRPADVKTGAYQTFTLSVPTEKDNATVSVKLDIPESLTSVTPTVKPGWTIQTVKHGEGDEAMITSITWTGGKIDAGYRDEFTFSAKTPAQPSDLQWKAYQTYKDGTVVSWDQPPSDEETESTTTGPFSVTKVAADSAQDIALKNADSKAAKAQSAADMALYTGIGGVVLAVIAMIVIFVRKSKTPVNQ